MNFWTLMMVLTAGVVVVEFATGRLRTALTRQEWIVIPTCALLNRLVFGVAAAMLIAWVLGHLMPAWHGALKDAPLVPAALAILLVMEVAFYWAHRWAHLGQKGEHLVWLWKIHRTHHSGPFMSALVTMRINVWWGFIVPTPWILGAAIYLGQGKAGGIALGVIYAWNLITHAHFRWDDAIRRHRLFGPAFRALEHIVVSPGVHHSHHGYGKDGTTGRNFAVTFAWLDWMFGTLHIPEGRPRHYGLPGRQAHWAEEIFYPLVQIDRARAVRTPSAGEPVPAE